MRENNVKIASAYGSRPIHRRQVIEAPEQEMGYVSRCEVEDDDNADIDRNRTQRMHVTHPIAVLGVHVEFLKQPDPGADQKPICHDNFNGPSDGEGGDRAEASKNRCGD